MKLGRELKIAKNAALEIGKIQKANFRKKLRIIRKTRKDFVSNVDMECQQKAFHILQSNFDYEILSEEKNNSTIPNNFYWVVDPIDGTHNYISGLPSFGISIGLMHNQDFVLGVVYLPYFDELLYAKKGTGAYLNENRIHVSKNASLEKSMVTYDNQFHLSPDSFPFYKKILDNTFTTRISGSAIYDLSLIASGIIDARIFNNAKLFDIAASVVIVTEAGGQITDFDGNRINTNTERILVSNGLVHDSLLDLTKDKL